MLTPEERYDFWEELEDRVRKLFSDIEDALNGRFAPYKFENGELVKPDKDTPDVQWVFDTLADLEGFLQRKKKASNEEYSAWDTEQDNASSAFTAWSLGLCPSVMSSVRRHMDFLCDYWPEIAKLKQEHGISKEDTAQAVSLWDARCSLERKAS